MMPFVDGTSVCRRIRERGDHTPVLMPTARHAVADRVEALDAGADDYVVKPFELEELLARLRALLWRASGQSSDDVLVAGPLELDTRRRLVSLGGGEVRTSCGPRHEHHRQCRLAGPCR